MCMSQGVPFESQEVRLLLLSGWKSGIMTLDDVGTALYRFKTTCRDYYGIEVLPKKKALLVVRTNAARAQKTVRKTTPFGEVANNRVRIRGTVVDDDDDFDLKEIMIAKKLKRFGL